MTPQGYLLVNQLLSDLSSLSDSAMIIIYADSDESQESKRRLGLQRWMTIQAGSLEKENFAIILVCQEYLDRLKESRDSGSPNGVSQEFDIILQKISSEVGASTRVLFVHDPKLSLQSAFSLLEQYDNRAGVLRDLPWYSLGSVRDLAFIHRFLLGIPNSKSEPLQSVSRMGNTI